MLDLVHPVYSKTSQTFEAEQQSKEQSTGKAIKHRLVVSAYPSPVTTALVTEARSKHRASTGGMTFLEQLICL